MNQTAALLRITKDAEIKTLSNGNSVINLTAVHSEKYKGSDGEMKDASTWYEVARWGKPEFLNKIVQYYKKGAVIIVCGKVSGRAYLANDGTPKCSLVLTATNIDIVKFVDDGRNRQASQDNEAPGANFQHIPEGFDDNNSEKDDLPF